MDLSFVPDRPGVYLFRDSAFSIIYIGKAKSLKKRVSSYFTIQAEKSFKTSKIKLLTKKVDFIPCESEREALLLERELIKKFQPFFNTLWKDSKSYPYVKITREDFPRVYLTRKKIDDGSIYFGPYPKVEYIRKILNNIADIKIINLRKCKFDFSIKKPLEKNKILHCIYYHTGQCPAPCDPKRISQEEYMMLVRNVKDFFNGKFSKLINDFKEKMKYHSDLKEYEKAAIFRDAIRAIEHIYEKVYISETDISELNKKFENVDIYKKLKEVLNLKELPLHIEAFDTSSLFGKYAVGSSVCFINGMENYSHYRHYKIKFSNPIGGSDDFKMIYEIVYRRLKKIKDSGEKFPELFLIDGGKGQLTMALKAANDLNLKLNFISLAKKNEEIYIPFKDNPIILEKDNPALIFLRKIRDEVHRFGITFHKKLRDKDSFRNKE